MIAKSKDLFKKTLDEFLTVDLTLKKEDGSTWAIKGFIDTISLYESWGPPAGIWEVGDFKGYFYPSYTIGTSTVLIALGDWIIDTSGTFRVVSVLDRPLGEEVLYVETVLRKQ